MLKHKLASRVLNNMHKVISEKKKEKVAANVQMLPTFLSNCGLQV